MKLPCIREQVYRDFATFSHYHMRSMDVDPVYPVLAHLLKGKEREQQLWEMLVYVAYYNIASSQEALLYIPEPSWPDGDIASLPTGTERRALRGGFNMQRHLENLVDVRNHWGGSFEEWLRSGFTGAPADDWFTLKKNLLEPWGNGRWAAYKTAEILAKVLGFPVLPSDMGNEFSTGPRKGLEILFEDLPQDNSKDTIALLDELGWELLSRLVFDGVTLDIANVETCLCDFKSLHHGHYYVGHDIDGMQEALLKAEGRTRIHADFRAWIPVAEGLWDARVEALPRNYLGELGSLEGRGWEGVDKERCKAYMRYGRILHREPVDASQDTTDRNDA